MKKNGIFLFGTENLFFILHFWGHTVILNNYICALKCGKSTENRFLYLTKSLSHFLQPLRDGYGLAWGGGGTPENFG